MTSTGNPLPKDRLDRKIDNLLVNMVYLIKDYDHDQDMLEIDRLAVDRTKKEILQLITTARTKAAIEARIDELERIDSLAYGQDYHDYSEARLANLQEKDK